MQYIIWRRNYSIYHDTGKETHPFATAGLGCNVSVAHSEEGDGDEPQGSVHLARRQRLGPPADERMETGGGVTDRWDGGFTLKCIFYRQSCFHSYFLFYGRCL